jgi:hypothetical protein
VEDERGVCGPNALGSNKREIVRSCDYQAQRGRERTYGRILGFKGKGGERRVEGRRRAYLVLMVLVCEKLHAHAIAR